LISVWNVAFRRKIPETRFQEVVVTYSSLKVSIVDLSRLKYTLLSCPVYGERHGADLRTNASISCITSALCIYLFDGQATTVAWGSLSAMRRIFAEECSVSVVA
jgi:hypothetical protein